MDGDRLLPANYDKKMSDCSGIILGTWKFSGSAIRTWFFTITREIFAIIEHCMIVVKDGNNQTRKEHETGEII